MADNEHNVKININGNASRINAYFPGTVPTIPLGGILTPTKSRLQSPCNRL